MRVEHVVNELQSSNTRKQIDDNELDRGICIISEKGSGAWKTNLVNFVDQVRTSISE